ncbi:PREDICTED: ABC transporter A family member 12 [Brassica oleracea var. oleracea]|uniref:ABC transporter A family member 12 n=1 Tax=Brassica oleracea var. oleracea TaxID=109376 RepID=UPI0006A6E5C8|nr:PREDICTED: ABC transporter A family member 12 [Brassica oleracea var. oleracea]
MADPSPASFWTQANALLRKNLTYQRKHIWTNVRLILVPLFLCLILLAIQHVLDALMKGVSDMTGDCKSNADLSGGMCPIPNPPMLPPMLQIPQHELRSVKTEFLPYKDLPDKSCRGTMGGSCPVTILMTGDKQPLGKPISANIFATSFAVNSSDLLPTLANNILGSPIAADKDNYADPGLAPGLPIYSIQPLCSANSTWPLSLEKIQTEVKCVQGLCLWRNNSADVNNELFKGSYRGNPAGITNEIAAAYDLMSTDKKNFNVTIWYNSTYKDEFSTGPVKLVRVPRSINLISNAYLKFLKGPGLRILFEFVKEVPKHATRLNTDIASLLGPLFFTWVVLLLFPVILTSLVYEKQERLRIIMKMHGLGDGPYWLISYAYFLTISVLYVASLVIFGSVIGLKYFRLNSYSIQFVFYFIYLNLQIALSFLVSSIFSKVKTVTVVAYILVYGTGLLGSFLFQKMLETQSFPEEWIVALELYPGFSLYRGLYEFSQYASRGNGMKWQDLSDSGMGEVLCIMSIEWLLAIIIAFYIDQVFSSGKHPFFFLNPFKKSSSIPSKPTVQRVDSKKVSIDMGKIDVSQEREMVQQLRNEGSAGHAILCDNLKKVYPGRDGNPPKMAVRGLYLDVPSGECFGMLGPNGAGKTSFISMMTGLLKPSSGTALVQGLDICKDMNKVYTSMGVCPQHDLLWEILTGREHLLFYGRLKNIKGSALTQAVEESLKSVSLFDGGVGDKPAGNYSGGMKRRLSVAISLIGNPKVVYLDEPSTGLDPASRKNLWDVIQRAKQNTAIILTTHSMEEAEFLSDRLGIFVDGALQCIGNSKELKSRYGGSYVFTMTTSSEHEEDVERLVSTVSHNAKKVYHLAGTQKFELPKNEVRIAEVFRAVEKAKSNFTVFAWGLADTTLEDVFIKVAKSAQAFISLS